MRKTRNGGRIRKPDASVHFPCVNGSWTRMDGRRASRTRHGFGLLAVLFGGEVSSDRADSRVQGPQHRDGNPFIPVLPFSSLESVDGTRQNEPC